MKQQDFNNIIDKISSVDTYLYNLNYHLPSLNTIIWICALSILAYITFMISTKRIRKKAKTKRNSRNKSSSSRKFGNKKEDKEKNKYRDKEDREPEHILRRIKMFIDKMMEKDRAKSITDSLPNLPELSRRQERTQERSEERERTQERSEERERTQERTQEKGRERDGPDRQNPETNRAERTSQQTAQNIQPTTESQRHNRPEINRHEPHKHINPENQRREDRRVPFITDLRHTILPRLDLNPISNIVNLMTGKLMPMPDLVKVSTPLHVQHTTNPVLRPEPQTQNNPARSKASAQNQQATKAQHTHNQRASNAHQQEDKGIPENIQRQFVALRCTVTQQFTRITIGFDSKGAVESLRLQTISITKDFFAYASKQNDAPIAKSI